MCCSYPPCTTGSTRTVFPPRLGVCRPALRTVLPPRWRRSLDSDRDRVARPNRSSKTAPVSGLTGRRLGGRVGGSSGPLSLVSVVSAHAPLGRRVSSSEIDPLPRWRRLDQVHLAAPRPLSTASGWPVQSARQRGATRSAEGSDRRGRQNHGPTRWPAMSGRRGGRTRR